MKIEFLTTSARPELQGARDTDKMLGAPMPRSKLHASRQMKQMGAAREVVNYLISSDGRAHTGPAARILAAASAWAYSDLNTFATVMGALGLTGEFLAVNVVNEPSLVDTTAYMFVAGDPQDLPGRLAILAFRGTNPSNTIHWLTDANTLMEPLGEGGRAHGGFLRGGVVLMPLLKALLLGVAEGKTLKQALRDLQQGSIIPREAFPEGLGRAESFLDAEAGQSGGGSATDPRPLALYLCGHGLGGAFAALTAAAIHLDPELAMLQMHPQQGLGGQRGSQGAVLPGGLRSVYTFGQPMFVDRNLAVVLEGKFGERLFRHVYNNDIVPRLPPRISGNFSHFGREFVAAGGVWVQNRQLMRQAYMAMIGNFIGTLAWVKDQLPLSQWIPMQFAWADHSPLNYLRVSRGQPSGFATPGDEFGGEVPNLC